MPSKLLIGLLDDNKNLLCQYESLFERAISENGLQAELTCVTNNPNEFIQKVKSGQINVCFLDINLGMETNGMAVAREIRKTVGMSDVEIIFATSYVQFMQVAFRVKPFDYLVKPVTYKAISKELNRLSKSFLNHQVTHDSEYLVIQNKYMMKRIQKDEIVYCEYNNLKTSIYGIHDQLQFYIPFNTIEEQLPENVFLHSQRNIIINKEYVEKIDYGTKARIYLAKGMGDVPLSRKYKKDWKLICS